MRNRLGVNSLDVQFYVFIIGKKKERNRARCESKRDAHTFMSTNMKFHRGYITMRAFNQTVCES